MASLNKIQQLIFSLDGELFGTEITQNSYQDPHRGIRWKS
ncbi:hypothetical protein M5D96_014143 [Drosophila gunungcola]|uniref:Uncharacterized protein n=1 Tax=Drosophila gunungcola TaxID=103775 RepID=A0A9P9Y9Z0_9MUSC|nr:hypothetical protein M5D96_014143 [Drosophila gunungcola]